MRSHRGLTRGAAMESSHGMNKAANDASGDTSKRTLEHGL
jgi:hypothetical protein